jgi:hypothetical protein
LPKIVDLIPSFFTHRAIGRRLQIVEIVDAIVVFVLIKKWLLNQVEVVHHIWEGRGDIHIPLGSTVTHNEALKIQLCLLSSNFNLLVVLMNLPSKVGCVDPTVALT